ncbi:PREDICTED: putative coiled-coil domain-containing protein 144C, partial [Galeopterus variegatus]|uniref:Coiled-coil domain-containing protein 144C n=1 Tax=Galeopterus variegatus TaxID=482537 RepID=A0ABM0SHD6_GALVR
MTAEEEQEKLDGNENKEPQDKVTLKTATPTEKTSENQTKQINLPLLQVQKMSQDPEMNKDRNREDIPVYPGQPFMQKYEGGWIQQEKLEWKNNSQVITSELKQRFGEIREKYRIAACSEEEPLRDNSKGEADLKKIPSNLTNDMLDCEGKDAFGFSGVLQAFPEQKEDPSLKNIFPPHSHSGSPEYACQSSSKLYLNENELDHENNKPDTEFVFNTNENLCNDTENKKGRNQEVVTVEVKEDQEFDMQMTKNMIQNTTDGELDIGHVPQSSDPKSLSDVWLTHSSEMKHMSQIKGQRTAVTEPYKKAKLTKHLFQNSSPALSMMELKKNEKEIWTSEDSVIVPMLEKANLLTGGPLQVNGNSRLGKIDQDEGRFAFKQEKENRRDADIVCDRLRNLLRRTEEQCSADAAARRLEVTLRTQDAEPRAVRDNWNPISDSHTEDLWHKNDMLQDEIAKLRLEIDTIKNQYQEKEKKYSRDIEIVKEKSDDLQKIMKLNEETSAKKIFQYIGQIRVLTDENMVLNSKLENEEQNKERLETVVESYHSRLPAAIQDHDQSQISERDLELALQKAEDECFHLQEKMNFDLSKLKDKNEFLSQKLSKAESRSNSLKIEFHHTRDALREQTLVLEGVKRDLSQTQCQMKETEHMYHNEQSKVNECTGKQQSVEERLSQLQHENVLLRQQLDEARNKADHKEKTVINIQHQCHDIVRKPQAQSKKGSLIVEERNKELINECNHSEEKLHHYENEKTEREVAVRPVQHKLADTLKKQPTSEASLEVTSRHQIDLEDETKDLKKRLCELQSQ